VEISNISSPVNIYKDNIPTGIQVLVKLKKSFWKFVFVHLANNVKAAGGKWVKIHFDQAKS